MFLKTGELKKMMKAALKSGGLYVGNINRSYLVYASTWGLSTDIMYAPNKFKALLMELIGDIPEHGEHYRYYLCGGEILQDAESEYPDVYELWKDAKDPATYVPITVNDWPHSYTMLQLRSDLSYKLADKRLTVDVIGSKELDMDVESMPERPSFGYGVLYWKNDTTIYWVHTTEPGERVREALFASMERLDFFQRDWHLREEDREEDMPELEDPDNIPY